MNNCGVISIWNNQLLAFISWEKEYHLQLPSIRCDIFCTLIDVLLIYMVLMWCYKLSLLSLIKMNYHIATAALPIVSCIASLPLIHHNISLLKSKFSEQIYVFTYTTQLPFLKYTRHRNLHFPTTEHLFLPDWLPFHSGHSSPIFLWRISPSLSSVLVIWVGLILPIP